MKMKKIFCIVEENTREERISEGVQGVSARDNFPNRILANTNPSYFEADKLRRKIELISNSFLSLFLARPPPPSPSNSPNRHHAI